jgi:xylulokinase
MSRRVHLGIDAGTQSTKAILLDAADGTLVALGRAAHPPLDESGDAREQHPDVWLSAARAAVRETLEAARANGTRVEVAGLAVSGQQHGLVCLGDRDRPVRPAKLWNDTTTGPDAAALTERLGGRAAVLARTGNLFLTGYTAPAIAWLRRSEPAAYARTRRICLPHDYLNLWLTGTYATEPGDASGTAYFDALNRRYDETVLAALDPERDWEATLPPVVPSRSVLGELRPDRAEDLGLPARIPVTAGGGDNMCSAIGAGIVRPGRGLVSLGTSGTICAYSGAPAADPEGEAATFCDSTGGWLPLACTLNCSGPLGWLRRLFGLDQEAADALVAAAAPGARGLTFLPYLDGERTPARAPGSAMLLGLRIEHGPNEIARAVYEGVGLSLGYGLTAVERALGGRLDDLVAVGGGAASDAWAQMLADAFDRPIRRLALPEAAAAGAALQARWVVDGAAPSEPRPIDVLEPNPPAVAALAEASERAARARATMGVPPPEVVSIRPAQRSPIGPEAMAG